MLRFSAIEYKWYEKCAFINQHTYLIVSQSSHVKKYFPREDSSSEPINCNINNNITSYFISTLLTVNHQHTVINTLTGDTSSSPKTTESYTMTSNGFVSARGKREVRDMVLSDYSFSFSLNRYSEIDGIRKALQILMHATPDMQILPADDTNATLEALEYAGDISKDLPNWETYFFNTKTSSRRENGTQTRQIETHAIVK